jgi:hypothetical protein
VPGDRVSIAVAGHPEFVLDYGVAPGRGSTIFVGRPERSPRQSWIREPRGPGFILRAGQQPALVMAAGEKRSIVLAPETHAVVWRYNDKDGPIGDADGTGVLTVKDCQLNDGAPVLLSRAEGRKEQSWCFWPDD